MCTGHSPFRAETSYGVLHRITHDSPRPIRELNPNIPEWLEQIVMKLLSKSREDRFDSAEQVAELLEGCVAHVQHPMTTSLPSSVQQLLHLPADRKTSGSDEKGLRKFFYIGFAALSLVFAGVLIVLELNKGTLTIESEMADVPIRIMRGDKVIKNLTVSQTGTSTRIAAGQYVVEIGQQFDEATIIDGVVTVLRGGTAVVKITKDTVENPVGDPKAGLKKHSQEANSPDSVLHLMRQINNPAMEDLSSAMGSNLAKLDWDTIIRCASTTSVVAGVLARRESNKDDRWREYSTSMLDSSKRLVEAAEKRDITAARKHFAALSDSCTNCHKQFRNPPMTPMAVIERMYAPENSDDEIYSRTLTQLLQRYNQKTKEARQTLFDPPIRDLTLPQLRSAFESGAQTYRKYGKHTIADALENSIESGQLDKRLVSLNAVFGMQNRSTENGEATFQQFLPHLECETGPNQRTFVAISGVELRWSREGWTSSNWGDIHPPIVGSWTLTKIMSSKEPLEDEQFAAWKRDHPQWSRLVIEEASLSMSGTAPGTKYDLALDYSGAVPVYRHTSDSETKFSGVFMSNGLVKDTELSLLIAEDGGESEKIYRATDNDAFALVFLRTNSQSDTLDRSQKLSGVTQTERDEPAARPKMTPRESAKASGNPEPKRSQIREANVVEDNTDVPESSEQSNVVEFAGKRLRIDRAQKAILTEDDIVKVESVTDTNNSSESQIVLNLTPEAGERFLIETTRLTSQPTPGYLVVEFDGAVLTAPQVRDKISNKVTISSSRRDKLDH